MKTIKIRIIFFAIALTYNLILGFYLRDFLILSSTLQVFYLLSALPTLFLTVNINSKAMRSMVYTSLILIAYMNIAHAIYCRRVFPILEIISLVIVFMYFICFADNKGKDNLLTKIYVLVVSTANASDYIIQYNSRITTQRKYTLHCSKILSLKLLT